MRAMASARGMHGCIRQAAQAQQPLPAWVAAPARRQRCQVPPAVRGCAARASLGGSDSSSVLSSSSSSSSTGWLLDTAASLDPATSSSSSSSNGSGSGRYDAIMMLGGGLFPDGSLPEWVVRRLEGSLHLYHQQQALHAASQTAAAATPTPTPTRSADGCPGQPWRAAAAGPCPIVLLGAATPHKPPVMDDRGYVLYESTAYAAYLMGRGVPAGDLLKETQSCDTVGNGYFSLLQHALPAGWRRIAVVTSEFHMPRTQATFDFVYGLAGRQLHGDPAWYRLEYRAVSDEGIFEADVTDARAAKEAAAVATWHKNTAGMRSLADLHSWLYATHLCYSVSRQQEFGRVQELDPKLAATY